MITWLRKLFARGTHRHVFIKDYSTARLAGYMRGVNIYSVTARCSCGKTRNFMTDNLL